MKLKALGLARSFYQMFQKRMISNTGPFRNSTNTAVASSSTSTTGLPFFKTSETNPGNLNDSHLGRFYTVDPEVLKFLYGVEKIIGIHPDFLEQCQALHETCILVRKPFLDIKTCIESYDLSLPSLRYVLYGIPGSGKTITLIQLAHYAYSQEYVVVNVPWMSYFGRFIQDHVASTLREDYYDHTTGAVRWLLYFKGQNSKLLQKLKLTTAKDYVWSKREVTPQGSRIEDIVEHGIARPVFASESIYALIEQLKTLSSAKKCKTLFLYEGANSLYHDTARILRPDKSVVPWTQLTLFEAFRQAFKSDWSGGAVVCTVDKKAVRMPFRDSDLPRYLLTKKGWEELDPFIPVHVDVYTPQEVQTTIDYYLERRWLQHPLAGSEKARRELEILSTGNPKTLRELCASR